MIVNKVKYFFVKSGTRFLGIFGTKLVFGNLKAALISEFQKSFQCVTHFVSFCSVKYLSF